MICQICPALIGPGTAATGEAGPTIEFCHIANKSPAGHASRAFVFEQFAGTFRTKSDGIDYRNFALCERQGTVTLNVRKTEEGKPLADKQATLIKRTDYEPGYVEVTVPATTLDDVVIEFKAESCTMWIDVEGSQNSVLTGGRDALKKAAMVFIEVEDKESWPSQWVKSDVDMFLFDAGLVPVARDFQGRFQHNVLFWREALLREGYYRRILAEYFSRIGKGRHSHIEAYQDDINSSAS